PLSYLVYLIPYKLFASGDVRVQLYALRLLSILLNVLVVLAAYVTGRELFRDDPTMALALPVFVMLLPQHLFLHSTVMNDHLVEAALAGMIALLTRTFRLGLNLPRALGMLVLLGIGLGAKRSAVYGIAILAFAFLVYVVVRWGGGRLTATQKSLRLAGTVIVLSLAVVGLVYAWNWLGANQKSLQTYIVRIFLFLPSEQFPFQLDSRVIEPTAFPLYASYLKYTFISLWGHFGWMIVSLAAWRARRIRRQRADRAVFDYCATGTRLGFGLGRRPAGAVSVSGLDSVGDFIPTGVACIFSQGALYFVADARHCGNGHL